MGQPKWTFGDRVRKARRSAGLSSREFAAALGVTNSGLAQWETDRSLPRNPKAVAGQIEDLYGVPATWLLTGGCPEGNIPVPGALPVVQD